MSTNTMAAVVHYALENGAVEFREVPHGQNAPDNSQSAEDG